MNRLAGEPSAYLRQHAHNPVDWQPFDDAAFAEARERNVPVFLSVGYAACHWCHVMAQESFEDPVVGSYLREHFVSIKVDREERPDVDDAYMAATQALAGAGGWPMSVFLTPSGQAFYAGTYFPPVAVSGRPSFKQVLAAVNDAWTQRPDKVQATAASLAQALANPIWRVRTSDAQTLAIGPDTTAWTQALSASFAAAVTALASAEDTAHGGFGMAPKFPPTPVLEFLIRHAAAVTGSSSSVAHSLAGRSLAAMVNSALFDQVGGGFARYSVTADWSEPHYEKMLYDNAGLLRVLIHWARIADAKPDPSIQEPGIPDPSTPEPDSAGHSGFVISALDGAAARRVARETIEWLLAELRLPGGAFASSLDADTVIDGVHHEGASYQWSAKEFRLAGKSVHFAATGESASALAQLMNIPPHGRAPLNPGRTLSVDEWSAWRLLLPELKAMRATRLMPARDDKVVAAWNGMLLAALAESAMVLAEPDYLSAALELGEYIRSVHWDGTVLRRVSHDGAARGIEGLLEDYAACADGFQALYAATGDGQWFDFAAQLLTATDRFMVDGTVFNSASIAAGLIGAPAGPRYADPFDNATTSPVAILAGALLSHAAYTGSTEHRVLAESLLGPVNELAQRAPRSAGGLLAVAQAMVAGPVELAIVGPQSVARDALIGAAWKSPVPGMVISVWDGQGIAPVPLMEGRGGGGDALAYVCKNMACARPVSTAQQLNALLG